VALDLVRHANRRRLGRRRVRPRRRLDLRRAEALARHLDRVVRAAQDVPEAVAINRCPVAVDPDPGNAAPVGVLVACGIAPEAARHAGPWLADHQLADLPAHRIALPVHHVLRNARDRTREGTGLDRRDSGTADDAAGNLGPAGVVDDRTFPTADDVEAPMPRRRVPRLARRADDANL